MPSSRSRLRQARKARGWSQQALADLLGMSWKTVSYWEKGTQTPQPYNLRQLVEIFGVPAEELGFEAAAGPPASGAGADVALGGGMGADAPLLLPAPTEHFVGRADEIATILNILGAPAPAGMVVALIGVSGVGKSALAAEVVRRLDSPSTKGHRFTQGIVALSAAGCHDLDGLLRLYALVAQAWRVDLGDAGRGQHDSTQVASASEAALRQALHLDHRALVYFDNVELDLPLDRLLALCGAIGACVLFTSTHTPTAAAISRYHFVQPLPADDSVRLFARRYRALGHRWNPRTDPPAAEAIARHAGYLPLALHLAALSGHSRGLSPRQLARELGLAEGPLHLRDPTDPATTLRHVFERFVAALPLPVRMGFALLGACDAHVVPVAIAEELLDGALVSDPPSGNKPASAVAVLDALALASLITRSWNKIAGEVELSIHPLIHAYARERWRALPPEIHALVTTSLIAALTRYVAAHQARHNVLALHEALVLGALRRALHETRNLARTARLASMMEAYLEMAGHWTSLHALLTTHQRCARRLNLPEEEAWLLARLGNLAYFAGHPIAARGALHQALGVARRTRGVVASRAVMDAHDGLGTLALIQDRLDEATQHFLQELVVALPAGDVGRASAALVALGDVMARRWRTDAAILLYRRALEGAEAAGDATLAGYAHMALGHQAYHRDERRTALHHYRRAHGIALEQRNRMREGYALRGLGYVAARQGRLDAAVRHFTRSAEIARAIGNRVGECDALRWLGDVLSQQGRFAEAREQLERAARTAQGLGQGTAESHLTRVYGRLYLRQGQWREAEKNFRAALALDGRMGDQVGLGEALMGLGDVATALGRPQEAQAAYLLARDHFRAASYFALRDVEARLRGLAAAVAAPTGRGDVRMR